MLIKHKNSVNTTPKRTRRHSFLLQTLVIMLSVTLFIYLFSYVMNPRNRSGIHFIENNQILSYSSPSNWLGDGEDYDVYRFSDEEMKKVIRKVKEKEAWKKYPIDSTTLELINEWHAFMENQSSAKAFMKESDIDELIPTIENGYYLLLDRSNSQSEESKLKYGLNNYSIFLLNIDSNTLYYIESDM